MTKTAAIGLVALGALGGFAYYTFIGCTTGTCPITSNPFSSTLYGGLLGFIVAASVPGKRKDHRTESKPER